VEWGGISMEIWDILDKNGNMTGKTITRGDNLRDGEYHLIVHIWIINGKGETFSI